MKKKLLVGLALITAMSFIGCGKITTPTSKLTNVTAVNNEEKKFDKKNISDLKQDIDYQKVKDVFTQIQLFKANTYAKTVKEDYKKIENLLSPELQNTYQEFVIPNATTYSTHLDSSNIIKNIYLPNITYNGKDYPGYSIDAILTDIVDGTGEKEILESKQDIIYKDGKYLVINDRDTLRTERDITNIVYESTDDKEVIDGLVYANSDNSYKGISIAEDGTVTINDAKLKAVYDKYTSFQGSLSKETYQSSLEKVRSGIMPSDFYTKLKAQTDIPTTHVTKWYGNFAQHYSNIKYHEGKFEGTLISLQGNDGTNLLFTVINLGGRYVIVQSRNSL